MNKNYLENKWWYRLFKVIYYFLYITLLIILFFIFPIVIIIFELLRLSFLYILTGEGNFKFNSRIWKGIKKIFKYINNFIRKKDYFGLNRLRFNLILFFIDIPLILFGIWLSITGFNTEQGIIGGLIFMLGISIFLYISIKRFHNIGISGWNTLGLFIPLVNIIIFFQLIFAKEKEINKKLKKEKVGLILGGVLLVIILIGIFYVEQFKKFKNTVELSKQEKVYSRIELLEQARKQDKSLENISDDILIKSIIETNPDLKTDF